MRGHRNWRAWNKWIAGWGFEVFKGGADPADEFVSDVVSTSGVSGITQSDLSFTSDSVGMEVGRTSWIPGHSFTARISFANQVPEPASLVLMDLGRLGHEPPQACCLTTR